MNEIKITFSNSNSIKDNYKLLIEKTHELHNDCIINFTGKKMCIGNDLSIFLYEGLMQGNLSPTDYKYWKLNRNVSINISDKKNITVDGRGINLIYTGLIQPFEFSNCENITIKNLTIDWEKPLFGTGDIVESDVNKIIVCPDKNCEINGGEPIVSYQGYDPILKMPDGNCIFSDISNIEKLDNGNICFKGPETERYLPGNKLIFRYIYSYAPVFHLYNCKNVKFENVTIHAGNGMGIIAHRCCNLSFEKLYVIPPEGRIMSVNCDATHFIACSGKISFSHCQFEAMGDDATNVHGFYTVIKKIIDSNTIVAKLEVTTQDFLSEVPSAGEIIGFSSIETLEPFEDEYKVDSILGKDNDNYIIKLNEKIPDGLKIGDLVFNQSCSASLIFKNCTVKNIRGRAVLIQTSHSVVKNCDFIGCTGEGVHLNSAVGWLESSPVNDCEISGNRFINCGYGTTKYCDAVGIVAGVECNNPGNNIHKNIVITDNIICGENNGIVLNSCRNVTIKNNVFKRCPKNIVVSLSSDILVEGCPTKNIQIKEEVSNIIANGEKIK